MSAYAAPSLCDRTIFAETLLARISEAASARDNCESNLVSEVAWLHEAGALAAALPTTLGGSAGNWADDPRRIASDLAALGRASLPLGRLFEGHVNAAQLIGVYGSARLKWECAARVRGGALLGVWGADGASPVVARPNDDGFTLSGEKTFCSGLGLVQLALVSARYDGQTWLLAVDATEESRADHSQWRVTGMRATASGGYDASGLVVRSNFILGGGDDYYAEPLFLGGMYRMCAVQAGGLEGLIAAFVEHARQRPPANPAILHYRVGSLLTQALLAEAAVRRLAERVAEGEDAEAIGGQAILTREGVERCIVECLTLIERAGGTSVHREGTTLSRWVRDISLYVRQGAIDDRLISVGAQAVASPKQELGIRTVGSFS